MTVGDFANANSSAALARGTERQRMTESTKLARLLAEVLRLSAADVESDERWAGVAELRQLDAEKIYQIAAGLCTSSFLIERELGADLLGSYKILKANADDVAAAGDRNSRRFIKRRGASRGGVGALCAG
jgi:hypothetical protein